MERKPKLFDKTDPYTGANYFREDLGLDEVSTGTAEVFQPERPHLHDELEMLFITEGQGILTVNGVELLASAGTLVWLFPFHVHGLRATNPEGLRLSYCRFSLGMLLYMNVNRRYMQMSVSGLEYAPPCLPLEAAELRRAEETFAELLRENEAQEQDCELLILSCLMRLVALFERRATRFIACNQEADRTIMWNALQYIQSHFNKKLDSASVAEVFGISVSQLNSGLRLLTDRNFSQNLRDVRIRNACAMMQFEELSIPFIARAAGYSSVPAFYRQFREVRGCTPDQHRAHALGDVPSRLESPYSVFLYINKNYRDAITVATAAKALYMGESTVQTLLEKNFHCTFSQLLTLVRLWVAAGLLLGTGLSVGDIGIASGFDSVRTFTRSFAEEFGAPPTGFRRSLPHESRGLAERGIKRE